MMPEEFIQETQRRGCQGTSISFNEPTLSFEWSLEVFLLARERGLYNTFVTNGYMTAKALDLLTEAGLNALNVDIKGGATEVRKHCKGIDVEHVWARCLQARELGLHLEITTLIIPGVNDDHHCLMDIARRIAQKLGPETPWHISGYFPAYRFKAPLTPTSTLEHARAMGKKAGLEYVYVGNVPDHPYNNTYCPQCEALLIERRGLDLVRNRVVQGQCPNCGKVTHGVRLDWRRHDDYYYI